MDDRFIVTLDAGSSKIALSVAQITGDNLQVIYYRETPSAGIRHGGIYNPLKASESIKTALDGAEKSLNIKIHQLVLTLPRWSVRQESTPASIEITNPEESISQEEVDALKDMAKDSYPLENEEREMIYSAIAQSFSTDDQMNATEDDIVGSYSSKLECNYRIFIGKKHPVFNIYRALHKVGVAVSREMFAPEAVGEGVLKGSEKDNGVGLIDFGADVTSLSIYQGGILRYYNAIPFGGRSITSDIAYEASIRKKLAENLKFAYGCCQPEKLQSLSEKILKIVNSDDGSDQDLKVSYLSEIITARVREIFYAMLYMIQKSGYASKLRSGLVLTGGSANLVNCAGFLKELSGYNVRIGFPKIRQFSHEGCSGINETSAATTVGMLLLTREDKSINCIEERPAEPDTEGESSGKAAASPETVIGTKGKDGSSPESTSGSAPASSTGEGGVEKTTENETESTGASSQKSESGRQNSGSPENPENHNWGVRTEINTGSEENWGTVAPLKKKKKLGKVYEIHWEKVKNRINGAFEGIFGENYNQMTKSEENNKE